MRRATPLDLFLLNAYWIGLSFMWNGLHNIIFPAALLRFVADDQKNTYLGLLTFVGLALAVISQPLSGHLSDRWRSRWGRRRPLMLIGTVFDFLFLALLGWAGGLWALALGYLGLQISSNVAHGPLQGLMPDRVPREQLGAASGVKNLFDMGGLVVASLLLSRLYQPDSAPVVPLLAIALVLAGGAAITLVGVKEEPTYRMATGTPPSSLHPPFSTGYAWLIASRFLFLLGIYGIQAFAQYYIQDVLRAPNPPQATGDLLAAIVLALMVFALATGWVSDRVGRKRLLVVAGLVAASGSLLLLAARDTAQLLIYGSVLGAGLGIFLTANWALANELAPESEAGMYLGLTNLATAGAGAAGRLEGPLIDWLNGLHAGVWWGYNMVFLLGAVFILGSVALLVKVPERR